jgi:hypothetical protein
MVLAFFYINGVDLQKPRSLGSTFTAICVIGVVKKFMKVVCQIRPDQVPRGWIFRWDNVPVHSVEEAQRLLTKKNIQLLPYFLSLLAW